jgi:hypothetical protein
MSGQNFNRYGPLQPGIAGLVHLPHAARTQQRFDLVWSQQIAGGHLRGHGLCQHADRRSAHWPIRRTVLGEKRLHLAAHFLIEPAGLLQKSSALGRCVVHGRMVEILNLLQACGVHDVLTIVLPIAKGNERRQPCRDHGRLTRPVRRGCARHVGADHRRDAMRVSLASSPLRISPTSVSVKVSGLNAISLKSSRVHWAFITPLSECRWTPCRI